VGGGKTRRTALTFLAIKLFVISGERKAAEGKGGRKERIRCKEKIAEGEDGVQEPVQGAMKRWHNSHRRIYKREAERVKEGVSKGEKGKRRSRTSQSRPLTISEGHQIQKGTLIHYRNNVPELNLWVQGRGGGSQS